MRAAFLVACLFGVVSCSETSSTTPDTGRSPDATRPDSGGFDGAVGPDAGLKLSFSSCTLLTNPSKPPSGNGYEGLTSAMAECATAKVPAKWTEPHGDTIDLFVKRYPAVQQPAKGQLWLLAGGPGGAGIYFEPLAFRIANAVPSLALDIYLPDHRGTGRSSFINFDITPKNAAACAAKTPHLDGLTATDAAKDIGALVDATRTASQRIFVFGGSYGTFWALRYLQVYPNQPTAVILEGTVPVGWDYSTMAKACDDAAHALLSLCQADTTCSAKLGPDPVAKASEALTAIETGTSSCVISGGARAAFGLFMTGHYFDRLLLPAAAYRVLRCSAADQQWLNTVVKHIQGAGPWDFSGWSNVVHTNIALSELWPSNPTPSDIKAQQQTMLATYGDAVNLAGIAPYWPIYAHDDYYGKWPSSTVPILVLQATLDSKTPGGTLVKSNYSGPTFYVELPKANHCAVEDEYSPMTDPTAPGCGRQVLQSFLADPTKSPDTSCIANIAPLDWGNPPAWWLARVGITDLWENP